MICQQPKLNLAFFWLYTPSSFVGADENYPEQNFIFSGSIIVNRTHPYGGGKLP